MNTRMKDNNDLISVIVPIYNTEKYLERCILSIINQSYSNLDIILINDGSTDNSERICENYALFDDRVRAIYKENGGVSSARNLGLDISKGKYILFVDSDDYIFEKHIEILYQTIKKYNSDLCISSYQKFSSEKLSYKLLPYKDYSLLKNEVIADMIIQKNFGWECMAKLYSKRILSKLRFKVDESIGEDFTFSYNAIHIANSISINTLSSYFYFIRPGSATQSQYTIKYDKLLDTAYDFGNFIKEHYPNMRWATSMFFIHSCIEILVRLFRKEERDLIKEECLMKIIKTHSKNVLYNRLVPLKFKLKIIILLLSKKLFIFVNKLYSKT